MYMLLQQTRRNLKIFLKDKANIFFSLLSPLIVLALYVLFLGRVQADGILAGFAGVRIEAVEAMLAGGDGAAGNPAGSAAGSAAESAFPSGESSPVGR